MAKDNPATRLHGLLTKAKGASDNVTTVDVWKSVLHVTGDDSREFVRVYHELLFLFTETVGAVKGLDVDEKLFLSWETPVANAIAPTAHHQGWAKTKVHLTPEVLRALEFTAHELRKCGVGVEDAIPEAELKKLLSQVEKLQKAIADSTLDASVRAILVQQADNIRHALHAYKIRGATVVKEALEQACGAMVLNQQHFAGKKSPVVEKFKDFVRDAYNAVVVALTIEGGTDLVKRLFSGGDS